MNEPLNQGSLSEFDIINRFFNRPVRNHNRFPLGIGDDAALIAVPPNHQLATSVDTLVADTHFDSHCQASDLGYKSLAVSLSDMAAMGAEPAAVLLALTLPMADEHWLQDFSQGFFELANQFEVELIGGNLTRGPLSISTVTYGWVPHGTALRRSGARPGNEIYITGHLGEAGLAVQKPELGFYRPLPRIEAGLILRNLATAAIDISDGLAADLSKLLAASQVGGVIFTKNLPLSSNLCQHYPQHKAIELALSAGEDYELCFTIPSSARIAVQRAFEQINCPLHFLGTVNASDGLTILNEDGKPLAIAHPGYQHFKK